MILTKIHRILKFKQSDCLKNTLILKLAKENVANNFEKDFFKLMNNSTFGKTMENLRERIKVRLVNNAGDYKKYVSKPSFVSRKYLVKILLPLMKLNQF